MGGLRARRAILALVAKKISMTAGLHLHVGIALD